jgi:hypothetical protein
MMARMTSYGRGGGGRDDLGARLLAAHPRGEQWLNFLRSTPPPQFSGRVGMSEAQFRAAVRTWERDWKAYRKAAEQFTIARTDCAGTSIEEFERAAGHRTTIVCPTR